MQDINDNHPLDLSYLIGMVGHNADFVIEIFDTFIEYTPVYLAELEAALALGNWDEVGNCAHKMKPTFSYIGRDDVKDLVQAIEYNARNQVTDQIKSDLEHLKLVSLQVYAQLELEKENIRLWS
ncbi:Hpt domain-containing protein [Pedobacter sp. CFBP9032]|uniref:Hpt domain-containing protein n=1 Tax=Pedobacter sp. CFBP9032 TaxID=3096539 RepID=UPI002A6A188A|nr:Hpt domain-containing protein [Pedobacter sp. CFBP9032]MDY0906545.1 Hpt domain-containing protein [Pedobacter sp. CFBP9032]